MYVPRHFAETRVEVLHDLIRRYPLGILVVAGSDGLDATHVPFEISPEPAPFGTLRCHVARANPVWRQLSADREVMVVFQGEQGYVSPSWYVAKQEHGKVVPTWDYVAVHAYGAAEAVHDAAWLRRMVEDLTNRHEQGRADPWRVSDAPAEYVEKLIGAIVGVQIPVTRLIGKYKLSQNRSVADRQGVVAGLERDGAKGQADVAALIKDTL
ncbi:MAG TPA: FMN-binding negative transcriptional regulator [Steroidobacteraceae bacterium]|nr:FMN-binding negative transcriptional regulator [Steroidobacteraceae bacterium]